MTGKNKLERFEKKIRYKFNDRDLLRRALTHKSALTAKTGSVLESYQRLEFLGDRVLALAVARMLYDSFPAADEGELARRLTGLVRNETCADVAVECDMGTYIILGDGEVQGGGREKAAILGDVCEAVIAAIFIDGGQAAADTFIEQHWRDRMLSWSRPLRDPKTELQEWAHRHRLPTPAYSEVSRAGPDHALSFVMEVCVEGVEPARGGGMSKREAQQKAASAMLLREGVWTKDDYDG